MPAKLNRPGLLARARSGPPTGGPNRVRSFSSSPRISDRPAAAPGRCWRSAPAARSDESQTGIVPGQLAEADNLPAHTLDIGHQLFVTNLQNGMRQHLFP